MAWLAAVAAALAAVAAALVLGGDRGGGGPSAEAGGVDRTRFGEVVPANAPGQTMYMERVTIGPGARLPEHFHQGTQIARIVSGELTLNVVSGTASVRRGDGGGGEEVTGPAVVTLGPGDVVVETQGLVHFGANEGDRPVVVDLAALLATGAPLATTTGTGLQGMDVRLTAELVSSDRSLFSAGPAGTVVYGWNRLRGTATLDGQPVGVDMLGAVNYTAGSGPFSGFVTFSFADGSTIGVAMNGTAQPAPGTADATFAATLGVVGGTGRYVDAMGTGTFVGTRTEALGTTVAATFDLTLTGAR